MPRTIAIGDIHGCRDELEELISKLSPTADDRVVLLGDLVNRGPDTRGVFDLVSKIPNAIPLLGNHELRLRALKDPSIPVKTKPGDRELSASLRPSDWRIIDAMRTTYFDTETKMLFVDGGFLHDRPWQTQPPEIVTRIQVIDRDGAARKRSECPIGTPWADCWESGPFVIYGHTPRARVYARPLSLGIDTGCVYGGMLTAYVLPEGRIVQVQARKKWFP